MLCLLSSERQVLRDTRYRTKASMVQSLPVAASVSRLVVLSRPQPPVLVVSAEAVEEEEAHTRQPRNSSLKSSLQLSLLPSSFCSLARF